MAITGQPMKPLVKLGREPGDCWDWLGAKGEAGYGKKTHESRDVLAHRWIWGQLFGPVPEGLVISHTCGNPGCVNPHHLRAITQAENCRQGAGTTLIPADVLEIRRAPRNQASARHLGSRFGVSENLIRDIWGKRAWRAAMPFTGPNRPRNQHTKTAEAIR